MRRAVSRSARRRSACRRRVDQLLGAACARRAAFQQGSTISSARAVAASSGATHAMDQAERAPPSALELLGGQEIAPRRARPDRRHDIGADHRGNEAEPRLRTGGSWRCSWRWRRRSRRPARRRRQRPRPGPRRRPASGQRSMAAISRRAAWQSRTFSLRPRRRHPLHPMQVGAGGEALARGGQHHDAHRRFARQIAERFVSSAISCSSNALCVAAGSTATVANACVARSEDIECHRATSGKCRSGSARSARSAPRTGPSASVMRASAGSMMPSSHSRALAK